jgi:hypothetical protein
VGEVNFSYLSVSPPFLQSHDKEAWEWWRKIVDFRKREFEHDFPGVEWLHAADVHSWHCALLVDQRIVAAARIVDARGYRRWGTSSPLSDCVGAKDIEGILGENEPSEAGQLILAKSLRLTKWAVRNRVLDRTLCFLMFTGYRAQLDPIVCLSRDEIHTDKRLKWVGFESSGKVFRYKTGTPASFLVFRRPSVNALEMFDAHRSEFEAAVHLGAGPRLGWSEAIQPLLNRSDSHGPIANH